MPELDLHALKDNIRDVSHEFVAKLRDIRDLSSFRSFLNQFGVCIAAVLLVIALLATWLLTRSSSESPGDPALAFFVDELTGAQSVHPADTIPPLPGKDGKPTLVQAIKYRYHDGRIITAYLVSYTPEAHARLKACSKADLENDPQLLEHGKLVRAPAAGSPWLPANDPQAVSIISVPEDAKGRSPMPVFPNN